MYRSEDKPVSTTIAAPQEDWRASLDEVRARLRISGEVREPALAVGSLNVLLYAPREYDAPSIHPEDEMYVIARGSAILEKQGTRVALRAGDLAAVPAGVEHRFEDMSPDFETWSVLCGAKSAGVTGTSNVNRDDAGA